MRENAYRKFHADHEEFLDLHDGEVLEAAAKRSLHFIEELGLECAVWPNLYWKTSMCETHERYTNKRRLEREHDEVDLEDVEGADGQRHSVKRSFRAKLLGPSHVAAVLAWLAGLQDLVRQIGPPQLYWTFAPWEMSFP